MLRPPLWELLRTSLLFWLTQFLAKQSNFFVFRLSFREFFRSCWVVGDGLAKKFRAFEFFARNFVSLRGRRTRSVVAKWSENGPKMVRNGSKTIENGPILSENGPKRSETGRSRIWRRIRWRRQLYCQPTLTKYHYRCWHAELYDQFYPWQQCQSFALQWVIDTVAVYCGLFCSVYRRMWSWCGNYLCQK